MSGVKERQSSYKLEKALAVIAILICALSLGGLFHGGQGDDGDRSGVLIARLVRSEGSVQARRLGSFIWNVNKEKTFTVGDALRTGPDGSIDLLVRNKQVHIGPSSFIILREPQGEQGSVEVVFGETRDESGSRLPAANNGPPETLEAQSLWWVSPTKETVYLGQQEEPLRVAWDSTFPGSFQLELLKDGRTIVSRATEKNDADLPIETAGVYTIRLTSPAPNAARLERRISVQRAAAPEWLPAEPLASNQVRLRWRPAMAGKSELQIIEGSNVVWKWANAAAEVTTPDLASAAFAGKSLYALIRTQAAGGLRTPWSKPLLLNFDPAVNGLAAVSPEGRVILKPLPNDTYACVTTQSWRLTKNPSATYGVEFRDPSSTNANFFEVPLGPRNDFCPPRPGLYETRLLERSPRGFLIGRGPVVSLDAKIAAPELKDDGLRSFGRESQLALKEPRALPIEIRWDGQQKQTLGRSDEFFRLKEGTQRLEVRYLNTHHVPISDWSKNLPLASLQARLRLPANVPLDDLAVQTRDLGTIWTASWDDWIWVEMQWVPIAKAIYYELETSTMGLFAGEQAKRHVRANRFSLPFRSAHLFFWRIRAVATAGDIGPWSPVATARVQALNAEQQGIGKDSEPVESVSPAKSIPGPRPVVPDLSKTLP